MKNFLKAFASSTVEVCVCAAVVLFAALPAIIWWSLAELNVINSINWYIIMIIIQVIWIRTGYKILK